MRFLLHDLHLNQLVDWTLVEWVGSTQWTILGDSCADHPKVTHYAGMAVSQMLTEPAETVDAPSAVVLDEFDGLVGALEFPVDHLDSNGPLAAKRLDHVLVSQHFEVHRCELSVIRTHGCRPCLELTQMEFPLTYSEPSNTRQEVTESRRHERAINNNS